MQIKTYGKSALPSRIGSLVIFLFFCFKLQAQMITGVWHGKIDNEKVEVKMILTGDSITGTSYYYESASRYRRYIIKGYVDETDNSVVWWDDQLIEDKAKGLNLFAHKKRGESKADFNCPGPGVMMLDGKMYLGENQTRPQGNVHLDKTETVLFKDEWDFVIKNYTLGANDPDIIDSVALIAQQPNNIKPGDTTLDEKTTTVSPQPVKEEPVQKNSPDPKTETVGVPVAHQGSRIETNIASPTIQQKFASREKVIQKEIPVSGDSIELQFYDNAEIDGDSISLFLNGKMIFEHVRLTDKAYVVKLSVNDLQDNNELIMVAENLGAIPPNTSYMVAIVGDKRYDAQLASTENSSAMIKLTKATSQEP
ncbi:MAG TPA: hypothetical protein VFP87_13260 [Chitinophagaceae bacterium]|nr:hypothetical protein [Chitinophagaceae bacterium]